MSQKGQPTPKRKEAEALRKNAVKIPKDKKAAKAAMREREMNSRLLLRRAMYTHDEKYLPPRDKGPIKAWVRDYVDKRISIGELFIPFAMVIIFFLFFPNAQIQLLVMNVWTIMFLGLIIDATVLGFFVRRELSRKYDKAARKGAVFYAITRSITMRSLRLPKPRVKVGGSPKEIVLPKSLR
ncbi:MAG: hypothetical protein RIS09_875 [Actinomycetota bacterium]